MRKLVLVALAGLVLVALMAGCRPAAQPGATAPATSPVGSAVPTELKVYVPCGMIIPMRAAMDAFHAKHPDIKVTGVFDNAGIIVERLTKKGEQGDLVVTPGQVEMGLLKAANMLAPGAPVALGDFELVVIVPVASTLNIKTPADLKRCKTIASASAETNSTGVSGKEALTKLGLWSDLQSKFIYTKHAIDAYTMVASGKADAAVAYRNCPLETNPEKLSKSKVRIAFSFPPSTYQKQPCLIGLLKDAKQQPAQAFIDFVGSEEGRKLLESKGMTGCLRMGQAGASCPATTDAKTSATGAAPAAGEATKPLVTVVAFYPDNERHTAIKNLVLGLPKQFGNKVKGEFVDFTTDEGFKTWQAAGMTCGGIQINKEQTWTYVKDGKPTEVTFKMAMDGEWTKADLEAVVKKALAEAGKKK